MSTTKEKFALELHQLLHGIAQQSDGHIREEFYSPEAVFKNLIYTESVENGKWVASGQLEPNYEYDFFWKIYHDEQLQHVYHYTSYKTVFEILKCGDIHLAAITGVNDRSEINLVNNYMGREWDNAYDYNTIAYHNNHFITSFSGKKDHLNSWRLYGDDAKGVMIEFEIAHHQNPFTNILFSRVFYDLEIFRIIKERLQIFKEAMGVRFGFSLIDYWKFFYKNEAYRDEEEIRLIIKNGHKAGEQQFDAQFKLNRYGIIVPYIELDCFKKNSKIISVKSITLGPKLSEPDLNLAQVKYMLDKKYNYYIPVTKSTIDHYR